jgi:hypothetical protein
LSSVFDGYGYMENYAWPVPWILWNVAKVYQITAI